MSTLGNHFLPNMNNRMTNPKAVFKGKNYRISIISDMILRLEYDETGVFNDYLTENIQNRSFPLRPGEMYEYSHYNNERNTTATYMFL